MRCSFRVLAASAISLAAGAAFEVQASRGDEAVKNSCSQAAFSEYIRENQAILASPESNPLKSVDAVIAQRRLQERFCIKISLCNIGDPTTNRSLDLPFRAAFSSCLRDEGKAEESD
jgi:hypothetical protein